MLQFNVVWVDSFFLVSYIYSLIINRYLTLNIYYLFFT